MDQKQQLILEEIVDKEYNLDKFLEFITKKDPEKGGSTELWEYDELVELIKEFTGSNIESNDSKDNIINNYDVMSQHKDDGYKTNDNSGMSMNSRDLFGSIFPMEDQNISNIKEKDIFDQSYEGELFTMLNKAKEIKKENQELNKNDDIKQSVYPVNMQLSEEKCEKIVQSKFKDYFEIIVKLSFPEFSEKDKTLSFNIETQPCKSSVRRDLKNFEMFRNMLRKAYPGRFIPSLPNIKVINDDTVFQIMNIYELFLKELLKDEAIRNSEILYDFLTRPKKDFITQMKRYESMPIIKRVSKIRTLSGKVKFDKASVNDNENQSKRKEFVINSIKYLEKLSSRMENYKKLLKDIAKESQEISKLFKLLTESSKIFSSNNESEEYLKINTAFSNYYKDLGMNYLKSYNNYYLNYGPYFEFLIRQFYSLQELFTNFNEQQDAINRESQELQKKKENLYYSQDVKRWHAKVKQFDLNNKKECMAIILPEESRDIEESEKFVWFLGTKCANEFKSVMKLIEKNDARFINENKGLLNRLNNYERKIISDLTDFKNIKIIY